MWLTLYSEVLVNAGYTIREIILHTFFVSKNMPVLLNMKHIKIHDLLLFIPLGSNCVTKLARPSIAILWSRDSKK